MKTLSNDITINVSTDGMSQGYVVTTIYARGLGVFTGQSYIPGDNSKLAVNVNDIAAQNRGKYDYLKLDDEGNVSTVPLITDGWGTYSYQRRFYQGQVGEYKVNVNDGSITYNASTLVLAGYDYPNKDLKPLYMEPEDSSLCRIMQGSEWTYNHDDEIGIFKNLLLPHYPFKTTDKYGFGLQIYDGPIKSSAEQPNEEYSLRRDLGSSAQYEVSLGSPVYGYSNTTYISLANLINGISQSATSDYDVSVYLKKTGISGDEFGDWDEEYTLYTGDVSINRMLIQRTRKSDSHVQYLAVPREATAFKDILQAYIDNAKATLDHSSQYYNLDDWNADKITDVSTTIVYHTQSRFSQAVTNNITGYEAFYDYVLCEENDTYIIDYKPEFNDSSAEIEMPAVYHGTCPVAILDACYSRYYLAWYDRYGDVQSQPINGKAEYSESISKSEITDYKMRKRVVSNEVKPTWKLNTGWINQDVYPMYESIFTSPYLLLYDTETDRSWNVIVTDNKYNEKTYKNQKSLISLDINVEANKTQNNIF